MEPATGASTWAFGSHKWSIYIGIFTRNAKIVVIHHIDINVGEHGGDHKWFLNERDWLYLKISIKLISKGSEARTV